MWKETTKREIGIIRPNLLRSNVSKSRVSSIQLSNHKEIASHRGSVNSIQVDLTEGRYLLAGASDATVGVYDIQCATEYEAGGLIAKHKSLFVFNKQHDHGHKYAVSSAAWYLVDTGLFVTGSYDHRVNVWDTNTTDVVMNFRMPGKVYQSAMSSIARSHMLIATGTQDVQVWLCDIASGAFAHTLSGHHGKGTLPCLRVQQIDLASCRLLQKSFLVGLSSSGKTRAPLRKCANGNNSKFHAIGRELSQMTGTKQRLHPGMLSVHDRAAGHYGIVTESRLLKMAWLVSTKRRHLTFGPAKQSRVSVPIMRMSTAVGTMLLIRSYIPAELTGKYWPGPQPNPYPDQGSKGHAATADQDHWSD